MVTTLSVSPLANPLLLTTLNLFLRATILHMNGVKSFIKKLLPSGARNKVANFYHLLEAIAANTYYGFPSRSAQVIMITGTNGNTTTAAYISSVLQAAGYKVGAST